MLLPETLKLHNHEAFEFHYIYFLPWKNQMVEAIEQAEGKVTCLSAKNNLQLLLKFNEIKKYCKQNQIQLIHAHLPWAGFVSRWVHGITRIPVLYTEHNMQERYHVLTKLINKFTFNSQTLGIGVSEDVTQSILKNIAPKIPVKTLLNGVNTDSFQRNGRDHSIRDQYNIPKEAVVVGTVAVFRFQKRLELWLEIMKKAIDQNPNIYGIIVGAGPLQSLIVQKHQELGLEGKVFFAGLQTEVRPFYEAMDIFLMSSSFEGLPIALLEAMSMSTAILTTDAGGIKEVIRPQIDGVIVPVDEWESLESHLVNWSKNEEEIKRFQVAARKRAVENFSLKVMVNALENQYNKYTK